MLLTFGKNKKNQDVVFFELLKKDSQEFLILKYKIEEKLKGQELSDDFLRLFSILRPTISHEDFKNYYDDIFLDIKDILEYLFKADKYYFSDIVIDIKDSSSFRIMSTGALLSETVRETKEYLNKKETKVTKLNLVKFIYNYLQDYKINYPELANRDELSHYKLTVITGLIILKLKPDLIKKFKDFTFNPTQTSASDFKGVLVHTTTKFVKEEFYKIK